MKYEMFKQEEGKPEGFGTYYVDFREKVIKGWYGFEETPEYIFKKYWKEYKGEKMRWEELRWDFNLSEDASMNIADFFRRQVNRYTGGTLANVQGADLYVIKGGDKSEKEKEDKGKELEDMEDDEDDEDTEEMEG